MKPLSDALDKARALALARLRDQVESARRAFEDQARSQPNVWAAYEAWQQGADPPGRFLADRPALRGLWSTYVRLAAAFASAETLPNWPFAPGIAKSDPTPPEGKKRIGS